MANNNGAGVYIGGNFYEIRFQFTAPETTVATNNYWGAAGGPGADPADTAGKVCDFNQGTTVVKPFATTAYGISP